MPVITRREEALEYTRLFQDSGASMAIFCTASHWNTEAILVAAQHIGEKYNLDSVPVAVAMTINYPYMPQAQRITYSRHAASGLMSNIYHLQALLDGPDSPYPRVVALPHLDHGDPERDVWALKESVPYMATIMFDGQKYPFEKNLQMTRDYVAAFGDQVMVEGIIEQLTVAGGRAEAVQSDAYIDRAVRFMTETGVDLLVADLGTEQQADTVGEVRYLKERAQALTASLNGESRLVLHGTSSMANEQMRGLGDDGVVRVNMWTRIAREAGQYAAEKLVERIDAIRAGDFEAVESKQYLYDSIEKAAEVMIDVMDVIGYDRLAT